MKSSICKLIEHFKRASCIGSNRAGRSNCWSWLMTPTENCIHYNLPQYLCQSDSVHSSRGPIHPFWFTPISTRIYARVAGHAGLNDSRWCWWQCGSLFCSSVLSRCFVLPYLHLATTMNLTLWKMKPYQCWLSTMYPSAYSVHRL